MSDIKHMILENGEYAIGQYVPEGATIVDSQRPSGAHVWENNAWVFKGWSEEEAFFILRSARNRKMQMTDWWATSDRTMTDEQKAYRQELRDFPSTASPSLDELGNLTGVTWPTEPS